MKKFFTFEGRMSRARYIGYSILLVIVMIIIDVITKNTDSTALWTIYVILNIVFLIIDTCITVQRLHDIERSGTHFFLFIVPLYNIYLGLVLLFKKGTDGPNKYGEDPL